MRRPWLAQAGPARVPPASPGPIPRSWRLDSWTDKVSTVPPAAPLANLPRSPLPAGANPMRVAAQ